MALIGSFPASASAVFNLDFLPEKLLIFGTSANSQALTNFSVVSSGTQLMSITNVARLTALAKFDSGAILSDPVSPPTTRENQAAQYLRLATGRINKATTITGTNGEATVQQIAQAILDKDPTQIEYSSEIVENVVGKVLTKNRC